MSYTHEQLATLKANVAQNVKSVAYDGRSVTYNSLDEGLRLIAIIERELNPARTRVHYPAFSRGT